MSKAKYTPWQRHQSGLYTADPERRMIASFVYRGDKQDEQYHALMAAAPDLLEALKEARDIVACSVIEDDADARVLASYLAMMDKAIWKAESRS